MAHPVIRRHIVERVLARRGRLHIFEHLDAAKCALVVIDMQGTFVAPGAPAEVAAARAIVAPINAFAGACRALGVRVIWVTHANRGDASGSDWEGFFARFVADDIRQRTIESLDPDGEGQQVWPELEVAPNDLHLVKNRYSALIPGASPLERVLRSRGLTTLLIAGTKTNVCCEATARDAMMMDFDVVMLSDCLAALSAEEHRAALETFIQQFGDVMTADEALAALHARPNE
jgi:ureidoacrylate peracid hydrolase